MSSEYGDKGLLDLIKRQTVGQWSWIAYDAGSFGFSSATLHTLLPVLFKHAATGSLQSHEIAAAWGYQSTAAQVSTCFMAPFVGSYADMAARRKLLTGLGAVLALCGAMFASVVSQYSWQWMFVGTVLTSVGYGWAITMCNSLLPFVFAREELHTASCLSCAISNVGGASMIVMLLLVLGMNKNAVTHETALWAVSLSGMWFLCFNAFFYNNTEEPPPREVVTNGTAPSWPSSLFGPCTSVMETLSGDRMANTRRFLLSSFLVSEGAGTVMHMSGIYAVTMCGISHSTLFWATLGNRVAGVFCGLGWMVLVRNFSVRYIAIAINCMVIAAACICATMDEAWEYWMLSLLLAATGTGNFSLGRSILTVLTPSDKSAEVFGFNAFAGQICGMLGPLMFAGVTQWTGSPRYSFVLSGVFIVLGICVFLTIPQSAFDDDSDMAILDEVKPLKSTPVDCSHTGPDGDVVKKQRSELKGACCVRTPYRWSQHGLPGPQ